MAFKQQRIVLYKRDQYGNVILYLPATSVEYVEGAIKDIALKDRALEITFSDGSKKYIDGIVEDVYTKDETDGKFTEVNEQLLLKANSEDVYTKDETDGELAKKLDMAEVANVSGKIPRYNNDGHLVLPSGIELW